MADKNSEFDSRLTWASECDTMAKPRSAYSSAGVIMGALKPPPAYRTADSMQEDPA